MSATRLLIAELFFGTDVAALPLSSGADATLCDPWAAADDSMSSTIASRKVPELARTPDAKYSMMYLVDP